MPERPFFVEAKGKKVNGFVPAQFLMRNGAYVMNPTPGGSQGEPIYSDRWGNNSISGRDANPNNYHYSASRGPRGSRRVALPRSSP